MALSDDVDPFTPGPTWDEIAQAQLGDLIIRCPEDTVAPDGTPVAAGTPLTVAMAQELGIHLVVGFV
jgi:hypothetical protein